jgi:hypothetical protein
MNPQKDNLKEQDRVANVQEQFGDGLRDESLPAALVLSQQEEARESNQYAPLPALGRTSLGFVP